MSGSGTSKGTEAGSALLPVALAIALGLTLAGVLALLGASESRVAAAHRDTFEARYAAESTLDRAILELQVSSSWDELLAGAATSGVTVGIGVVTAPGRVVDLASETTRLQARTDAGPDHGGNTPRWTPFLWAPFTHLVPGQAELESALAVVAWLADDEAERDGDAGNDSNDAVWVHAVAYGPSGTSYAVEALVTRPAPGAAPLRRLVWRSALLAD